MKSRVFGFIEVERARQDAQWGGPSHDDQHGPDDWLDYIQKQVDAARNDSLSAEDYRRRLVKIAALAVAGYESNARLVPRGV